MSIYEKLDVAMENNDAEAYADLLHDDFKFVRHATNTEMTKSEWVNVINNMICLLYTSPSPRDRQKSRMPSSA